MMQGYRKTQSKVRPGSNVELHMCQTKLQFRSTQINEVRLLGQTSNLHRTSHVPN